MITTIQKFPFIVDGIADLSDKRFAVIIDEAHSSQSGTAAGKMNQAMGNTFEETEEEEQDPQDKILEAMRSKRCGGMLLTWHLRQHPKTIHSNVLA
jgi:type I restriction enzyme R subunit